MTEQEFWDKVFLEHMTNLGMHDAAEYANKALQERRNAFFLDIDDPDSDPKPE